MKKNQLILPLAILILLAGTAANLFAQKSVQLMYNLSEGDQYSYTTKIDQDIVFEASGQTMTLDQLMDFYMTSSVKKVSDSITIVSTIDRIKMTQKIFGMEVKFDSDEPSANQNPMAAKISEAFGSLIGKSYVMVMDKFGNIGSLDVSEISDNEDLANNLSSGTNFASYPENAVSVGDSWERDIEPLKTSDMMFHVKYTLLKLSGSQATLKIEGTITANKIDQLDADMNLSGEQNGEMIIDSKTGWLIESNVDQNMKLFIEQNGTKFPATIDGTVNTTSKKK